MSKRHLRENREARRQRDKEWCETRLTLLRIVHGYGPEAIQRLRQIYPTRGMLRAHLEYHREFAYLAKDKLYEHPKQETRETQT